MLVAKLEPASRPVTWPPMEEAPNLEKLAKETDQDMMLACPGSSWTR